MTEPVRATERPGRWGLIAPSRDEALERVLPATRGAGYAAAFGDAVETTLTGFAVREFDRLNHDFGRQFDPYSDPYISPDEANERFGIDGHLSFDAPIPESRAAERADIRRRELARASAIARSPATGAERFAAAIAGSIIDPAGLAVSVLPGGVIAKLAPGVRVAALSSSRLSRAGAFAFEGAAASLAVEGLIAPLATIREGRDYTFGDAMINVLVGAGFGGASGALRGADLSASQRAQGAPVAPETVTSASDQARAAALQAAVAEAAEDMPVRGAGAVLDLDAEVRAESLELDGPPIAARIVRADEAIASSGRSVDVEYALVEARDLIMSQRDDGRAEPRYPSALQPRDRGRADMRMQVEEMSRQLDPRRLGETFDAATGAPLAARDGVVESGNGRALAIRRAYNENGSSARAYRDWLGAQGYQIDGMDQPVLVRLRSSKLSGSDREAFAREANARTASAMSVAEQARADARAMTPDLFAFYQGGDVDAATNREFLRRFFDRVADRNDRNALTDAQGAPSGQGLRRVGDAIVAYAYDDLDLIMRLTEGGDVGFKQIAGALRDAAPEVAALRAAIKSGDVPTESDFAPLISEALAMARIGKRQAGGIQLALDNADAFAGEVAPEVVDILRLFYKDGAFEKPRARSKLAGLVETMARVTRQSAEPSLIGAPVYVRPKDAALDALDSFAAAAERSRADPGEFAQAAHAIRVAGRDRASRAPSREPVGQGDVDTPGGRSEASDGVSELDLLEAELDDAVEAGLIERADLDEARNSDPVSDPATVDEALRAAAFCLREVAS